MLRYSFPVAIAVFTVILGAGCETAPKTPPADPSAEPPAPKVVPQAVETLAPWDDPANPVHRRTVHFTYDRSEILPEYAALLRVHAGFLAAHPNVRLIIEGHADERGTREFNLALGEQRAQAVRGFLMAEGIPPAQLETASYGEEKPASSGYGEASWAQNRRAFLDYQRP